VTGLVFAPAPAGSASGRSFNVTASSQLITGDARSGRDLGTIGDHYVASPSSVCTPRSRPRNSAMRHWAANDRNPPSWGSSGSYSSQVQQREQPRRAQRRRCVPSDVVRCLIRPRRSEFTPKRSCHRWPRALSDEYGSFISVAGSQGDDRAGRGSSCCPRSPRTLRCGLPACVRPLRS
jgi:hypothetical protein